MPVTTSIFELFKIGPGPSSSHTIGPMAAGHAFAERIAAHPEALAAAGRTASLEIHLFGSLSATGKGHGTDRAVLAGLLGQDPATCDPAVLDALDPDTAMPVRLAGRDIPTRVVFDAIQTDYPFSNTLVFCFADADGAILWQQACFSVGGGFIQWEGEETEGFTGQPVYPYDTMAELQSMLHGHELRLHSLMLTNERAITGADDAAIMAGLDTVIAAMETCVENGLAARGRLPGPIGLERKAGALAIKARSARNLPHGLIIALSAYAFAASEENASGHRVVTAPTCGAAGVVPAVLFAMRHYLRLPDESLRQGLLASAAIGFLAKHNASVAGADVGCQGEVGVASAMAAALLAYGHGHRFRITANAAESALEHHLGMTCDPVQGYVQIPCIERNAMGAVKAYTAYLIASAEIPSHHKVSLDDAIKAMAETGRDMNHKYKETSQGGLAVSLVNC